MGPRKVIDSVFALADDEVELGGPPFRLLIGRPKKSLATTTSCTCENINAKKEENRDGVKLPRVLVLVEVLL